MEETTTERHDPAQEIENLRAHVAYLCEEREVIKQRVTTLIRDLVFQNDELRKQLAEAKVELKRAANSTRKDSQKLLQVDGEKSPGESDASVSRTSSSRSLKRIPSDSAPSPLTSSPFAMFGRKGSSENNVAGKKVHGSTWKEKMKYLKRKTTLIGITGHKEEEEEGVEPDGPFELGIEQDDVGDSTMMDERSLEESKPKEFEIVEEDQPDLIFVKQEGSQKMPIVKAGTTERLIDRLLPEKYPDPDYLSHFLLTYRSFTTPETILDTLANKFNTQLPSDASPEEVEDFNKNRLTPIRLRITNVLKTWLSKKHSYDLEDEEMIPKIQRVIQIIEDSGLTAQADLLKRSLQKLREDKHDNVPSTAPPPRPIFTPPLNINSLIGLGLTDLDPLEAARQITIKEYDLFKVICPKECLNQSWNKAGKEVLAPNVLRMIHWSNDVSGWVTTEVLSRDNPRQRSEIIKTFLRIAKHCRELNNFNAVFEILAGLQAAPIYRLAKTWEKLERGTKQLHKELQTVTSREKNFQELRNTLKKSLPPCIPYLGMFLTDLTFIDTGHSDRTQSVPQFPDGLINFIKLRQTAQVIKQIQLFQHTGFNLESVPAIQEFFGTIRQTNIPESEAFKRSLILEPREPQQ